MNLEERYNAAGENTYVGRVRARQSYDAGAGPGVNFLDGDKRTNWSPGSEAAPDAFQSEFTRNEPGGFLYGGGGLEPAATNDGSYPLSRWLDKSLKIAFDGQGPSRLPAGYWRNTRFTTVRDVRNGGTDVHNYAPVSGKKFEEAAILSELSKGKITGPASGPSPAGLNG
jgi:hypothetical protein